MEPLILFLIALVAVGFVLSLLNTRQGHEVRPVVIVMPAEERSGGCMPLVVIFLVVVIVLYLLRATEGLQVI